MGTARPQTIYRNAGDPRDVRDICGNTINQVKFKDRNCLRCSVVFQSSGSHNRLCNNCRNENFNETSPWAVEQGTSIAGDKDYRFSDTRDLISCNTVDEIVETQYRSNCIKKKLRK